MCRNSHSIKFPSISITIYVDISASRAVIGKCYDTLCAFGSSHLPNNVFVFFVAPFRIPPAPVHHRRVYVGRTECVRFVEQRDDAEQDCAYILRRIPTFAGQFTGLRVVHRRMQNTDTKIAVLKKEKIIESIREKANNISLLF